jgi:hypothetical protein
MINDLHKGGRFEFAANKLHKFHDVSTRDHVCVLRDGATLSDDRWGNTDVRRHKERVRSSSTLLEGPSPR